MPPATDIFEQPTRVRAVASLLDDREKAELAALAAAAYASQIPAERLAEQYSHSVRLLDDTGMRIVAAELNLDNADEYDLWTAWVAVDDPDQRRDILGLAAARAAHAVVAHTGDVDTVLDSVLGFLNVDTMLVLATGAELLYVRAAARSLN